MIAGRMVVENRRVLTVDMDRLRDRVAAARDRLAIANADNRRLYEPWSRSSAAIAPASPAPPTTSTATGARPNSSGL